VVATAISAGISLWDRAHDKPVSAYWYLVLTVPLFWAGAVAAWSKERRKVEALEKQRGVPKLFLNYKPERPVHPDHPVFFVQTEGEKNAFDVEVTSEVVVTTNHRRIFMEWEVPKCAVGKNPIPIKAMCRQYQGDSAHVASTYSLPQQIHTFFEFKKNPNELVVTLNFKDVEGKKCPPKRFLITSKRDFWGNFDIGIGPLED
jgi:hypothetical protein